MQESELKLRFDDGVLTAALAAPAPLHPKGWLLIVTDRKKRQTILQKQRGEERVFSSLDACFSTAKRIGFRTLKVAE